MRGTRSVGLFVLGLGWCAACGGESRREENGSARAPSAGLGGGMSAGSGGAPASAGVGAAPSGTGGASGGSGASVGGAACDWGARSPSLICVPSCAVGVTWEQNLSCVDGAWGCGPDRMDVSACPLDSCARASDHECCETDTGQRTAVTCREDGSIESCPAGSVNLAPRALCIAAGASATNCEELDGEPCARAGDRCSYVRTCSTRCECMDSPDGLKWSCFVPLC